MNVLMPDGTTITGVPEGITQSELLARYGKYTADIKSRVTPPTISPEEQSISAPLEGIASLQKPVAPKPPSELAMGEELGKGVGAGVIGLKSMWENAGLMKDIGAMSTVQQRQDLFDKIETGQITSPDQLRGLDQTSSQARAYFMADPATREKMRERNVGEIGRRTDFVKASMATVDQYQKDAQKYKGRTTDLTDVEGVKDFANWLSYNVGSGAVQMAPIILAAVTTGGAGVATLGIGMGTGEAIGNRLQFLEEKIRSTPELTPNERAAMVIDYVKKTGDTSLAVGIVSGALDAVLGPAATLAKRGLGEVVKGETRKEALKAGVKEIPKGMGQEFITGGAQEATQLGGALAEGEIDKYFTQENMKKILNAAAAEAAGSIAGGAATTGARVYGADRAIRAKEKQDAERQALQGRMSELDDLLKTVYGQETPSTKEPEGRIEPTFDVEPTPPEAGIAGLTPKAPAAPAAPAAPVAEEDQPAQDLEAMLQEALAATGSDINNVNVPKAEEPVEAAKPLAERISLPEGPARVDGYNESIDVDDAVLLKKMIVKTVDDGLAAGKTRQQIIDQLDALTKGGVKNFDFQRINEYMTERGVKETPAAEQPPSTKLIEEVLPETKPAPTVEAQKPAAPAGWIEGTNFQDKKTWTKEADGQSVQIIQTGPKSFVSSTADAVGSPSNAFRTLDEAIAASEKKTKTPTAAPTARAKEDIDAELKKLMLESIRDKTPNPERDAQIEKLTAERKALEPAAPAKPAAKVSKAKVSEEEKIVDAIKDSAYLPNTWQTTRTTVNEFIAKHGKKTFERAVEMGLLDNKIGDGRLFPSNKYAYQTSLNYYDAQGNKLKQPTVTEAKPAEPTKVEAEEPKADFGNFTVADYANDLQLLKTDTSVRPNYVVLTIGLDKQNESKPESIAYVRRQMEPTVEANRAQFSEDLAKQGAGVIKDAMDNLLKYGRNPIWAEKILMKLRSVGGSQARLANAMLAGARDMWEKGDFHDAAVRMEYFAKSDDNRSRAFRPNYGIDDKTAIKEFRGRGGPQEDKFSAGPERAKLIMEELKRQDKGEETAPTKKATAKRAKKEVKPSGPVPEAAEMDKLKQEMQDALGDLSMVLTKGTRLNIVPEDEQKLLPILSRVMDIAFKMGYIKFKEAAKYVLDMIRAKMGDDQADQISLDHLQGAYISMAGKYQDEGASTKKEVIAVESLEELDQEVAEEVAEEAPEGMDINDPDTKFKVAQEISQSFLSNGDFRDITEARKMISEMTGQPIKPGTAEAKAADEAIEVGVVIAAREIIAKGRKDELTSEQIYDKLVDLYDRQPNLNVRSSTSVAEQAYSTPAPLAFVASELAGITGKTSVYEPTGGNGMLVIGANPKNVIANELNEDRFEMLSRVLEGGEVSNENALDSNVKGADFDVVIENPPFGKVGDISDIDHEIVMHSLEGLRADGRAVLIVGGVQSNTEDGRREGYRGKAKREFYYNLYNQYNVVDHFTAGGRMYSKQGTTYPVDVIVIDGKGKSQRDLPAADLPKLITTYEQLKEKLNDRMVSQGDRGTAGADVSTGAKGPAESEGVDRGAVTEGEQPSVQGGRPAGEREQGVSEPGSTRGGQREPTGGRAGEVQPRPANESKRGAEGKPVSDTGKRGEGTGAAGTQGRKPSELGGVSVVSGERVESGLKEREKKEEETANQVSYTPHSRATAVGTLVPRAMAQAIEDSIARVEAQVGNVDEFVAEQLEMDPETLREQFSGEQIDALVLAIRNAEEGKGFIIGDQTGVGKGRVVAAMIKYALNTGKIPIFVTEKPNLYSDMIRDLDDIGMTDELGLDTAKPKIFITNSGESIPYTLIRTVKGEVTENNLTLKPAKSSGLDAVMKQMIEKDDLGNYKVIFTTYSQLQSVKGKTTERQNFIKHFGAGNYMIFDESHNAGGAGVEPSKETKEAGAVVGQGRAGFVRDLVKNANGTFFSSATYAKRPDVMDLYSSTDMKLAVDNISQLSDAIKAGGIPMQQTVANMLTQVGQYIRRERTFAGVSYDTQETKVDKDTAENMATSMRDILAFSREKEGVVKGLQKSLDKQGARAGLEGEKTTVQSANFGSIMHNLIDQMLLSLKAQDSVRHAIERLKAGEKVVMTVSNTMGSFLQSYADDMQIGVGDPVELSFADLYIRYLEKQRMVTIKKPGGQKEEYRLTDEDLGPALTDRYNEILQFIRDAGFGSAPISPIDYMHSELRKAGYKTEEITGRTVVLSYENATVNQGRSETVFSFETEENGLDKSDRYTTYAKAKPTDDRLSASFEIGTVVVNSVSKDRMVVVGAPKRSEDDNIYIAVKSLKTGKVSLTVVPFVDRTNEKSDVDKDYQAELDSYKFAQAGTGKSSPVLTSRSANIKQRVNAVKAFNSGTADVIILNQAGSTGLSLHASIKVKDQRKRHMIIVQPEKNIDTHMQMLGRVHRTGQVIPPAYSQMMADIPAEMRPAAVLLKKMASLSANTTASRKSAVSAEGAVDFMNDYGGQVAQEYLRDNPDVYQDLGGEKITQLKDNVEEADETDIRRLTGYIPILPIKQQEEVYKDLIERYNDLIEREDSMGSNKLEAKSKDLDAQTVSSKPITDDKGDPSLFAQPAFMERVDIKRTVKPYSKDEVQEMVKTNSDTYKADPKNKISEVDASANAFLKNQLDAAMAGAKSYSEADPVRLAAIENQLKSQLSHVKAVLYGYPIGSNVSIKNTNGVFVYGVVTNIEQKGKTKNPVAGSDWKMTLALANGDDKSLSLTFSQIGTRYQLAVQNEVQYLNPETLQNERIGLRDVFDRGATVRREKRWMVTGNILSGFAAVNNMGEILSYTKNDGTTAQGVLMPRTFDFEKEQKNAPIRLKSVADVMRFFDEFEKGSFVSTPDSVLRIRNDGYGRYKLLTSSSKREGGTFFLDKQLTAITGDFYKTGTVMTSTVYDRDKLEKAINYILRDRQDSLIAASNKDEARAMFAPKEPFVAPLANIAKLPPGRSPELTMAAQLLESGAMTKAEYDEMVNFYKPIKPLAKALEPATEEQVYDALDKVKREKIDPEIMPGVEVGLRLDIPAFNRKGVYVVSIHSKGTKSGPGRVLGYSNVAKVRDVTFGLGNERSALKIAGGAAKDALQTIEGKFVETTPEQAFEEAQAALNNPQWVQIGVDPTRHSYFYDKNTTQPVVAAEEVIQIGNMVLGKNVTYGSKENYLFSPGLEVAVNAFTDRDAMIEHYAKLRQKRASLIGKFAQGEAGLTEQQMITEIDSIAKSLKADIEASKPKRTTAGNFFADATKAWDAGIINDDVYDVIDRLYKKFPEILEGLSLSITKQPKDGIAAGQFFALPRIVRLYKGTVGISEPSTIRHEIAHSLEQMMSIEATDALVEDWRKNVSAAIKAEKTTKGKQFFEILLEFHAAPSLESYDAMIKALPSMDYYQYTNPSEYWAVNAEPLMARKLGSGWDRFVLMARRLYEGLKYIFGFDNKRVVHKVFNDLMNARGERIRKGVLADYVSHMTVPLRNMVKNYKGGPGSLATWDAAPESTLRDFTYRVVDKHTDMKMVVKQINDQVDSLKDEHDPYLQETLYHSSKSTKTEDFIKEEMRPFIKKMDDMGVSMGEFEAYLHARHAGVRNKLIADRNPGIPDGGSGMFADEIKEFFDDLNKHPEKKKTFEELAKTIDGWVEGTQDLLVSYGLETPETVAAWREKLPGYVPLKRDPDELDYVNPSSGLGQGFGVRGSFSKLAAGSYKTVVDIVNNVALQREAAIIRGEKAKVGRAMYALAIQNPNPNFWKVVNPDAIRNKKKLKDEMEGFGLTIDQADAIFAEPRTAMVDETTGLIRYRVNPALRNSPNVFPVRINGKDRYVFFNAGNPSAKRMAEALKNMDANQLSDAMGVIAEMTRLVAAMNTQYNPVFGAWNFVRDAVGGTINLSSTEIADHKAQVLFGSIPAMRAIYTDLRELQPSLFGVAKDPKQQEWVDLWQEFRTVGGITGYSEQFSRSKDKATLVQRELARLDHGNVRKAVDAMLDWLSDYNDTMENAVRLSAYKAGLDAGMTSQRAAALAKNLTVNFNRKGQATANANALYAFFNARVQGTARMMEVMFEEKNGKISFKDVGKKIVAGGMLIGTMQAIALMAAGFDGDEPPDFLKSKNIIIPTGNKTYLIYPMPLGWNLFPNIGREVTEYVLINAGAMKGRRSLSTTMVNIISQVFDMFNPLGAGSPANFFTPTVADPIVNVFGTNKDAFGRPISRESRETNPTPGWERSRDTATSLSKALAYGLNYITGGGEDGIGVVSPTADQLDYFAREYAGGVGREITKAVRYVGKKIEGEEDIQPFSVPIVGKLYGELDTPSAVADKFYKNVKAMAEHEGAIKRIKERKGNDSEYRKENKEATGRLISRANYVEKEVARYNKELREMAKREAPEKDIKAKKERRNALMNAYNEEVRRAQ